MLQSLCGSMDLKKVSVRLCLLDDHITRRPDAQMVRWPDDQMAGWPEDRMARSTDDWMARRPYGQKSRWHIKQILKKWCSHLTSSLEQVIAYESYFCHVNILNCQSPFGQSRISIYMVMSDVVLVILYQSRGY